MKKLLTTLTISIMLSAVLIPYVALAADPTEDPLVTACKSKATNEDLCVTEGEKKDMIFTVLEESIDTPNTEAGGTQSGNTRSCFRYTEILKCTGKDFKEKKVVNQQLLLECPKDIPDTGTDENGQYFDCQEVTVILVNPTLGGTAVLQVYLGLIYRWMAGIIGIVAVLTIIISGIQISIAKGEGEPSVVSEASGRIVQALAGVALLFFSSALLYVINPTFFQTPDYSNQNPAVDSSNTYEDPNAAPQEVA